MREPDFKVGEKYLSRWYVIPRNRFFNIYLHRFEDSDDDIGLHDHPWWSLSVLLKGRLKEIRRGKPSRFIRRFVPVVRSAMAAHRLVLVSDDAWTIFITGPRLREWGFWIGDGWISWEDMLKLKKEVSEDVDSKRKD